MSVFALFGAVKNLLRFSSGKDVANGLLTFSRLMGVMLIIFSILTTSKQFFGEPITCQASHSNTIKPNLFSAYCFMNGTSTKVMNERLEKIYPYESHVGVTSVFNKDYSFVAHTYYQWIPFILFFQGVAFYLPYRLWKHSVGTKIHKLLAKINDDPFTQVSIHDQVDDLAKFVAEHPFYFGSLSKKLFAVDFLALIQAVLQMYFLDIIFDGQYFGLGCDFYTVKNAWWEYRLILEEMFPMIVSCQMPYINSGGSVNMESGCCTMNMNILNQKLFITSWILHMAFIVYAIVSLLWNLFLVITPILRYAMLRYRAGNVRTRILARVHDAGCYGQYVLLTLLAKNMEQEHFDTLLSSIAEYVIDRKQMDEEFSSNSCITTGSSAAVLKRRH